MEPVYFWSLFIVAVAVITGVVLLGFVPDRYLARWFGD